jgi:hypothetical protein
MEKLELSVTEAETKTLLLTNPFGLIYWGRVLRTEKDASSFAVHTGLINLKDPNICVCGATRVLEKAGQQYRWRCPQPRCRTAVSMLKNTWFSESRIPMMDERRE